MCLQYDADPNPNTLWYIVFLCDHGQECPWWLRLLTSLEFRHVLAVQEAGEGSILVDSVLCHAHIAYQEASIQDVLQTCHDLGFKVVKVRECKGWGEMFSSNTCVGLIKSLLGINNPLVWSVRSLYRLVIRRGGVEV